MTLLSMIQNVADELGVTRPSSVIGSSDQQVRQLLALANREGKLLATRGNWTVLTAEHTFNTVSSTAAYALPADFGWIINETTWDRANYRAHRGPLSPPLWQQIASGLASSSALVKGFRIKGSTATRFYIDPTPSSTDAQVFEYQSTKWCQSAASVAQAAWAADTDTGILSEDLMELGIKWRFLKAKGFDYGEEFRTYEMECDKALGRDGGKPILYIGEPVNLDFNANIQDDTFPS